MKGTLRTAILGDNGFLTAATPVFSGVRALSLSYDLLIPDDSPAVLRSVLLRPFPQCGGREIEGQAGFLQTHGQPEATDPLALLDSLREHPPSAGGKAERAIIRIRLGLRRRWCGRDAVPNVVQLNQFVECGLGNGLHALEDIPLIRSWLTGILWIEERGSALQDQFAEEGCVDEVAVGDIGVE